jgi:hypothetical protein
MNGMRMTVACLLLLGAAPLLVILADDQSQITKSKDQAEAIGQLIRQLGDRDFGKREEANCKLLEIGNAALPALERARESDDLEVRTRAGALARAIQDRIKERATEEFFAKLNRESVDRFVDRIALAKEPPKDEDWDTVVRLAEALAAQAFKVSGREWLPPKLNYKDFKTICDGGVEDVYDQKRICVDGMKKDLNSVTKSILVSSGPVPLIETAENSIVIVDGNLEALFTTKHCIVLCLGDIESMDKVVDSVIIATGQVRHCTTAEDSFFQVRSIGTHCVGNRNVYLNCQPKSIHRASHNNSIESEQGPLAKLKFFGRDNPRIELIQVGEQVQIGKLAGADMPFTVAGLREGDEVLAVGGVDIKSTEDCRRALRRKAAAGGDALLKIRRGEETLEHKVRLKD